MRITKYSTELDKERKNTMNKGDKICTINEIDFFYGGWNDNGWHLVYTYNENFRVGDNSLQLPTERDCKRIYRNYYED